MLIKNPCFFGGFPCLFLKKQGKEGQGSYSRGGLHGGGVVVMGGGPGPETNNAIFKIQTFPHRIPSANMQPQTKTLP